MKADTMNDEHIELPQPAIPESRNGISTGLQAFYSEDQVRAAILADRASRSRAASEPGEVARLAEDCKEQAKKCAIELRAMGYMPGVTEKLEWGRAFGRYEMAIDRLASMATSPASEAQAGWLPLATAPKDGTIVRLLVRFSEHPLEDDNEKPIATIGGNCGDNTGEDKWQFAGWSWDQDCFTEGEGEVVGWMPMLASAPQPASSPVAAEGQKAARLGPQALDLAMRGLIGVIGTAQAQATRILANEGDAEDRGQDRRDLPATLAVIRHAVESLATPTASMADAAEAVAEAVADERIFDLTLECEGRAVECTFTRQQIDALVDRLREHELIPGPRGENAGGVVEAQAVIAELVALKDLKDATECWVRDVTTGAQWPKMPYEERMAACAEYNRRKPLAWAAARACATAWGLRIAEKGDADHA